MKVFDNKHFEEMLIQKMKIFDSKHFEEASFALFISENNDDANLYIVNHSLKKLCKLTVFAIKLRLQYITRFSKVYFSQSS